MINAFIACLSVVALFLLTKAYFKNAERKKLGLKIAIGVSLSAYFLSAVDALGPLFTLVSTFVYLAMLSRFSNAPGANDGWKS